MNKWHIQIKIPKGRVQEILDELHEAQRTIQRCYTELEQLGVLVIEEKTDSGN